MSAYFYFVFALERIEDETVVAVLASLLPVVLPEWLQKTTKQKKKKKTLNI